MQIGLIGFGTVGTGVLKILKKNRMLIEDRLGTSIDVVKIADKDLVRKREIAVPRSIMTKDPDDILDDPEISMVIELIGGLEPARRFILKAISHGKHVVTANKALLAEHGGEIFDAARDYGVEVGFEASVAGGIPILKAIREGLVGNRISSIYAIINGTSNYILSHMSTKGLGFHEALDLAREKGFAEADPSLDVDGTDAAHKLAILIIFSFGCRVRLRDIYTEGIRNLSPLDIQYAKEFGYRVKLLAIAGDHSGRIEARVHPTMVPINSQLAMVESSYNAIHISGDAAGPLIFSGQGAGMMPAASAVVSDIVDIARRNPSSRDPQGNSHSFMIPPMMDGAVKPMGDVRGKYYLRFTVVDRPGVLAQIARILGQHRISIAQVIQKPKVAAPGVPVLMLTHEARERDLRGALKRSDALSIVKARTAFLRIEDKVL